MAVDMEGKRGSGLGLPRSRTAQELAGPSKEQVQFPETRTSFET
jgi:hypothetical protein